MNKIIRLISVILLIVGVSSPVWARAKKSTFDTSKYAKTANGLNGHLYKLQKPLLNDSFPADEREFWKHLYFGVGAGTSFLGNTLTTFPNPGFRLNGQVGSWFTPVHGVRLLGKGGTLSVHGNNERTWFAGVQADYLLNLSYLLRGYNPLRKFELIGTVGVEYDAIRRDGKMYNDFGIGSSLQMRFNVAPSLFFFIEPRLAVQSGDRYDGYVNDLYRIKFDASLSLGLGYKILTGKYRTQVSSIFEQKDDDNLYFGVGGGGWLSVRASNKIGPFGQAYVGKQLSAASAIQLTAAGGYQNNSARIGRTYSAFGTIDYVLNLDNALGGYQPDLKFNLLVNVGAGLGIARQDFENTFAPAFSLGLTGLFRLAPNWALTLHPQVYMSNSKFFATLNSKRPAIVSADLGVRYTIGDYSNRFIGNYEEYDNGKKWFITTGAGIGDRFRIHEGLGSDIFLGVGKRFTPVSSWRLIGSATVYPTYPTAVDITAGLDYLSSITTAMCGYDPDRLFDMQLVMGIFGGMANYDVETVKTFGAKVGLQANFRINEHMDVYVEPQALLSRLPVCKTDHGWIPEGRVNIGLRYRLGTTPGERGTLSETPYGDAQNFAGISGGPSAYTGGITHNNVNVTGAMDLNVGRWFTMVSGARLTYSSDFTNLYKKMHYVGTVHADYLLNLSSLLDRSADRKFHVIGALGVGCAFGGAKNAGATWAGYGGVQLRYNLPWYNLDVHVEPGLLFMPAKVLPAHEEYPHSKFAGVRMMAGVSYRF